MSGSRSPAGPSPAQRSSASVPVSRLLAESVTRHRAGDLDAAAEGYEQILGLVPKHPDALHLLGLVSHQRGDQDRAVQLIRRAIAQNRRDASYHGNLAAALLASGRPDEAILASRKAIALDKTSAEAHNNLGNALMQTQSPADAEACFRQAISLKPDWPIAHNNLGSALRRLGRLDDAEAAYHAALRLRSDYSGALSNLGRVLHEQARYDAALDTFDSALRANPDNAEAHANRGVLLLTLGRFVDGWAEYEWRDAARPLSIQASQKDESVAPTWDGADLGGKTILLRAEQGIGSAIHFVRYAPLVAARGGRVVIECRPALERLFGNLLVAGQPWSCPRTVVGSKSVPEHDVAAPLMSLPYLMGTSETSIPCDVPYLAAEPALIEAWRDRLSLPEDRPTVGLVWSGNPAHENDANRSMPAEHFLPLIDGVPAHFISLQIGSRDRDLEKHAPGRVQRISARSLDFADTAAILHLIDAVVSVDTAVAHLAGALARPCWLLVPFVPEWRWQVGRSDSPWYPSLELFRQTRPGDWPDVIRQCTDALASRLSVGTTS